MLWKKGSNPFKHLNHKIIHKSVILNQEILIEKSKKNKLMKNLHLLNTNQEILEENKLNAKIHQGYLYQENLIEK